MSTDNETNEPNNKNSAQSTVEPDQVHQLPIELQQDRGLLDLAVELSLREITAGSDFTLFVKIKNPFANPIWIRDVHVSLPSELELVHDPESEKRLREQKAKREEEERKNAEVTQKDREEREQVKEQLEALRNQLVDMRRNASNNNEEGIASQQLLRDIEFKIQLLQDEFSRTRSVATFHIENGAQMGRLRIGSPSTFYIENGAIIDDLEISDTISATEELADPRRVQLASDRPGGAALQPGNTSIYKVVLAAKDNRFFRPAQYRLQFSVNYSFAPPLLRDAKELALAEVQDLHERPIFTNSISHELSIRASLSSVIWGSVIGGLVGSTLQLLQDAQIPELWTVSITWPSLFIGVGNLLAVLLTTVVPAIILSVIAIIFTARKSETQSFVSVEDFWGGVLIGFLIGYTGTSFFESLTNISELTSTTS
jgi:hypothetical protein